MSPSLFWNDDFRESPCSLQAGRVIVDGVSVPGQSPFRVVLVWFQGVVAFSPWPVGRRLHPVLAHAQFFHALVVLPAVAVLVPMVPKGCGSFPLGPWVVVSVLFLLLLSDLALVVLPAVAVLVLMLPRQVSFSSGCWSCVSGFGDQYLF